jgi:hypothetical protein
MLITLVAAPTTAMTLAVTDKGSAMLGRRLHGTAWSKRKGIMGFFRFSFHAAQPPLRLVIRSLVSGCRSLQLAP